MEGRKLWFQLVEGEATGREFAGIKADAVKVTAGTDIQDVRNLIHGMYDETKPPGRNLLAQLPPGVLTIYKANKADILDEDSLVEPYGSIKSEALIVVVPWKRKVWIQLMARENEFVAGLTGTASVSLSKQDAVEQLRDAVLDMYKDNLLKDIAASNLTVFENRDATEALTLSSEIGSRGETEDSPVIVIVSEGSRVLDISVSETSTKYLGDLRRYRGQGKLIQQQCAGYCNTILSKIDQLYQMNDDTAFPFICVEGSSGMGKSQLAFALVGQRPSFYWLATKVKSTSQNLYQNFRELSDAFQEVVRKDSQVMKFDAFDKTNVLDTNCGVYGAELWTYGFIRALLKHCSSEDHQRAREVIHFENSKKLHVEKCDKATVRGVIKKMKEEKKLLPFFVLDEMTPNSSATNGIYVAAFQRNIFRVCGLVVIVMGTDSKISNLVAQSEQSRNQRHEWMSVVPRFPRYQIRLSSENNRAIWLDVVKKYPVVEYIALHSRGGFATHFVEGVVKYAERAELWDLLDHACAHVVKIMHVEKQFLSSRDSLASQAMAISFTNAEDSVVEEDDHQNEPPAKKRKLQVGSVDMHLHFANLVDEELTDIAVSSKSLYKGFKIWKPQCRFPAIDEDLLLYLVILGGKSYSSYFDVQAQMSYSTKYIFKETGMYPVRENANAVSNDYKMFENFVANAIFCSSRRNGVVGMSFVDFFASLLGEFRGERWEKMALMAPGLTPGVFQPITASDLFEGYVPRITALANRKIPFLAPPNAKWPARIVDTHVFGCVFGHLVRARNAERCDVYVQDLHQPSEKAMFVCECKYWDKNVDSGTVNGIIGGLNAAWTDWAVVFIFCVKLAELTWTKKKNKCIGCVKISQGTNAYAHWIHQPEGDDRKKLVIVIETGSFE